VRSFRVRLGQVELTFEHSAVAVAEAARVDVSYTDRRVLNSVLNCVRLGRA
jgi:hypothetical protein